MAKKNEPFKPVTTNTQFFKGIDPTERAFTGKDASEDQRHAYNLVESEYGPSKTNLNKQLGQLGKDQQHQTNVQEQFGENHDSTLSNISDQLQRQLQGITERTGDIYDTAAAGSQQAFQGAAEGTQGASDDVLGALNAEMQRLGLGAAGSDPVGELTQQTADATGRHQTSGAASFGNLAGLGADMESIAAKREGDAAQEWAGHRKDFASEIMANINDINREHNDRRDAVLTEITALEQARGRDLEATLKEVIEDRLERERQADLDEHSKEMASRGMDVQEGYLGLSGKRFGLEQELGRGNLDVARGNLGVAKRHAGVAEGGLDLQREQLGLQKDQLQAEIDSADSPTARLAAQLDMQKVEAEIRALDAQSSGGGDSGSNRYQGVQGTQSWAYDNHSPAAADGLVRKFNELVTNAYTAESQSGRSFNSALMMEANNFDDPLKSKLTEMAHILIGNHADYAE